MAGNFYKVACSDCENGQAVFGKVPSIVNCVVCGTTLTTPTGSNAESHGEVVETVERRDSDELEA